MAESLTYATLNQVQGDVKAGDFRNAPSEYSITFLHTKIYVVLNSIQDRIIERIYNTETSCIMLFQPRTLMRC